MAAHQALAHRRPLLALGVGEIGEAQDAARKDLAVQADQVVHLALGRLVERVVGRAHVGELGVAAGSAGSARRQQRILGRHVLERAVGVPELVAEPEQAAAVVARQHLVVLVEVGDVVQVHARCAGPAGAAMSPVACLERPELAAEGELLVVGRYAGRGTPARRSGPCRHGRRPPRRRTRRRVRSMPETSPAKKARATGSMGLMSMVMAQSSPSAAPWGAPTIRGTAGHCPGRNARPAPWRTGCARRGNSGSRLRARTRRRPG